MRVWQEFYCGECQGYMRVKLNMGLNFEVFVVCPKCRHEHRRIIKDGQIYENGRYGSDVKEEICPPMSAWSEDPWTDTMRKAGKKYSSRRDGVKIKDAEVPERTIPESTLNPGAAEAHSFLAQLWFEKFGGRQ